MMTLLRNGSGTCTALLLDCASDASSTSEANAAPPKPEASVALPTRTRSYPAPSDCTRLWMMRSAGTIPSDTTLTRQFSLNESSKYTSPARFGTPTALPYAPMPSTAAAATYAACDPGTGVPKRNGSALATTSAPMHKTSRKIPPTPVAAPSNGTTCDGWLWLSCATTTPYSTPSTVPARKTPASSPTPTSTSALTVGSLRSSGRLLLYEQCSLHWMANACASARVGSRPMRCAIERNSAGESASASRRARRCNWSSVAPATGSGSAERLISVAVEFIRPSFTRRFPVRGCRRHARIGVDHALAAAILRHQHAAEEHGVVHAEDLRRGQRSVLGLQDHDARHTGGQLQAREDLHAGPIRTDDRAGDHRVRRRCVDEG